jgi:hypothetical protein
MATRSVVGRYVGDDAWIGRYVHWDGYPANMVMVLLEIVLRDGFDKAISTLVFENYGWSGLYPIPHKDDAEGYIKGYGYPMKDSKSGDWITWETDHWGTEYAYIIEPSNKSVTILEYIYPELLLQGSWHKSDVIDFGPAIARVQSGETTIQDEVERRWQTLSVLEGVQ